MEIQWNLERAGRNPGIEFLGKRAVGIANLFKEYGHAQQERHTHCGNRNPRRNRLQVPPPEEEVDNRRREGQRRYQYQQVFHRTVSLFPSSGPEWTTDAAG